MAPGAFSLDVPVALSNKDASSSEDKRDSSICNPTLYVGVFEYLSNMTVCSGHLTKKPLV